MPKLWWHNVVEGQKDPTRLVACEDINSRSRKLSARMKSGREQERDTVVGVPVIDRKIQRTLWQHSVNVWCLLGCTESTKESRKRGERPIQNETRARWDALCEEKTSGPKKRTHKKLLLLSLLLYWKLSFSWVCVQPKHLLSQRLELPTAPQNTKVSRIWPWNGAPSLKSKKGWVLSCIDKLSWA